MSRTGQASGGKMRRRMACDLCHCNFLWLALEFLTGITDTRIIDWITGGAW